MLTIKILLLNTSRKGLRDMKKFFEKQLKFGNGAIKRFDTNSPSIEKVIALSNFLNVPIDYLIIGRFYIIIQFFHYKSCSSGSKFNNQFHKIAILILDDLLCRYYIDQLRYAFTIASDHQFFVLEHTSSDNYTVIYSVRVRFFLCLLYKMA